MTGPTGPLSSAQERLWLSEQMAPGGGYVIQRALRLVGPLDVAALRAAVRWLVARHDVLRTAYREQDWSIRQVTLDEVPDVLRLHPPTPGGRSPAEVDEVITTDRSVPFDLDAGPPLRLHLLPLGPADAVLLLSVHHIAFDGWSMRVFFEELTLGYDAFRAGRQPELPPAPSYQDYAATEGARVDGPALGRHLSYWGQALHGVPSVTGPSTDAPAAARTGDRAYAVRHTLGAETMGRITRLCREHRCTPYMALLACYAASICQRTGTPEVTVATAVSGRFDAAYHRLVGLLVNVVPIRVRCPAEADLPTVLRAVREACLSGWEHSEAPYERVVAASRITRHARRPALAQVLFDLRPRPRVPVLAGLDTTEWVVPVVTTRFEVELHVEVGSGTADGQLIVARDLFHAATADALNDAFVALVDAWFADPHRPLGVVAELTKEHR